MSASADVVVDVWGDFAMFTRPDSHVERQTYKIPTPSACRGILNAIYSKPKEFYYEITCIEVMKPIRVMSLKRNEIKTKADPRNVSLLGYHINPVNVRTQRMCTYLRNVYYRIHAKMVVQQDMADMISLQRVVDQFNRRVEKGKCFYQPYFGTSECLCYFSKSNPEMKPISDSNDFGVILYDVFDIRNNIPLDTSRKAKVTCKTHVSFFHAYMINGVINVPTWDSGELLMKGEQHV